ncbi:MAG TPA: GNAT family N-acetyltransferase [Verrucomicrobiae bacterium]|nr:GNAT family N-acetyltransferase [Verrucomicrobiae bacterium]
MHNEWKRDNLIITTDPARQDVDAIHAYLTRAYWCENIPREIVERAVRNSLCFGLFDGASQVGLARVVTDYATYAYLCDVYVLESHRGRGLGKWLIECVMAHPQLQGLRRFNLATRDAHELYKPFGFQPLRQPEAHLEKHKPDIYKTAAGGGQSATQ